MNSPTSRPSHSRTSSNGETAGADSRQVLLPTQGHSIFILNPIVIPSSYNNVSNNTVVGATNNGLLPLHSLSLQLVNSNYTVGNANNGNVPQSSATQNGNHYASFSIPHSSILLSTSQEFPPPTTRKEEPVDLDGTEIPLSLMQAYNYQAMSQNSLQTGCIQLSAQLQACNKEKASLNMEIARLNAKCSQLEKEKNDLESLLAGERKECLKKKQALQDNNVQLDDLRKEAKLQESYLQKERADGDAKAIKIEELQKNINEIKRKSEETDKELQEAKDINQKIVDEYFDSITKPTTLNKLLSEQLAKNQTESSSQYQMSTLLANNILEHCQSQERNLMIQGSSTIKAIVASRSKKRKPEND